MPEYNNTRHNADKNELGVMSAAEISVWYDHMIPRLRLLRGVRNATEEFRCAVLSALQRFSYTRGRAALAQKWLEIGKWNEYRATGILMLTDFFPTKEQLSTLGEPDLLINQAARSIVAELARRDYVHKNRVAEMIDEVQLQTWKKAEREILRNNTLKWQLLINQKANKSEPEFQESRRLRWKYHPRFRNRIVLHSQKVDVRLRTIEEKLR